MLSLLVLFLLPFASAGLILLFSQMLSKRTLKLLSVFLSLIPLCMLLLQPQAWIGSHLDVVWIPALSIHFSLAIDSLSLLFLFLVALIIPVSLIAAPSEDYTHQSIYLSLILSLQGILIGFFTARDLVLFTFFWETMLIPLFAIIALWGGTERKKAAIRFLIYMIAGSVLMIASLLFFYFATAQHGEKTFDLIALAHLTPLLPYTNWLGVLFMLAFAVKTPLFPFHAWLPETYYQAPIGGTLLLAALLSKAGIYGIIRIGLGLFPGLIAEWRSLFLGLSIVGVLYAGFAAWMQSDFKKLIAYSSLSHVNFILVGLFIGNVTALSGAVLQAINHSITITGLFLTAYWLEIRLGSSLLGQFSGLAAYLPKLCWITLIFALSSVALPGTNNFIGEFMILFGLFTYDGWLTLILGTTIILSVIYMLRWMQITYFQSPSPFQKQWADLKSKELALALPLIAIIFWIGLYPNPLLKEISATELPSIEQTSKA